MYLELAEHEDEDAAIQGGVHVHGGNNVLNGLEGKLLENVRNRKIHDMIKPLAW